MQEIIMLFNRAGIILNFLSFWFVTPELIGEHRLKNWERKLEQGIPTIIENVFTSVLSIIVILPVIFVIIISIVYIIMEFKIAIQSVFLKHMFAGLFAVLILVVIWNMTSVISKVGKWLTKRITEPLLKKLANDNYIRQRSLVVGIVMFIVGNVLQFIATF